MQLTSSLNGEIRFFPAGGRLLFEDAIRQASQEGLALAAAFQRSRPMMSPRKTGALKESAPAAAAVAAAVIAVDADERSCVGVDENGDNNDEDRYEEETVPSEEDESEQDDEQSLSDDSLEECGDSALQGSRSEPRIQPSDLDAHSNPFFSVASAAEVLRVSSCCIYDAGRDSSYFIFPLVLQAPVAVLVPRRKSSVREAPTSDSNTFEFASIMPESGLSIDHIASAPTTVVSKRTRPSQSQVSVVIDSLILVLFDRHQSF